MILDIKAEPNLAGLYDVRDAVTGEKIALPIFYADDATGVFRYYLRNADGLHRIDFKKKEILWEERRREHGIRIVSKVAAPMPKAVDGPGEATESWRDRPPLL